jgi:hypothetical protein
MQLISPKAKLGLTVVGSSCLTAMMIGFNIASANAVQFRTIETTGTLSGTFELPNFNPNFNQSTTRIDTDETGTFFRGSVPVYQSEYVKSRIRNNDSTQYYVDFKGIPVVSFDAVLNSPVLSGGQLTSFLYQGRLPVTFQGVVQDEFNLVKAFYQGTVTDPINGKKYQGTFEVKGFGPRYSDANGGNTPTVFDFQSDIPGSPTITSLAFNNAELEKLSILVPIVEEETSVPEPSTIGGLLLAGILGFFCQRKHRVPG